jgi:hypothetical protein
MVCFVYIFYRTRESLKKLSENQKKKQKLKYLILIALGIIFVIILFSKDPSSPTNNMGMIAMSAGITILGTGHFLELVWGLPMRGRKGRGDSLPDPKKNIAKRRLYGISGFYFMWLGLFGIFYSYRYDLFINFFIAGMLGSAITWFILTYREIKQRNLNP